MRKQGESQSTLLGDMKTVEYNNTLLLESMVAHVYYSIIIVILILALHYSALLYYIVQVRVTTLEQWVAGQDTLYSFLYLMTLWLRTAEEMSSFCSM